MSPDADREALGIASFLIGLVWSPVIASAALFPALLAVIAGEWLRLRSLTANVALGGAAAFFTYWLRTDIATAEMRTSGALVVVLALGFVGGFFYWLVAGRNAGRWLDG